MPFWISADVKSHAAARTRNKRQCRPGRLGEHAVERGVCYGKPDCQASKSSAKHLAAINAEITVTLGKREN